MTYREYVIAAYVLFGVMLLWDWLAPKIAIARAHRAAGRIARRRATRASRPDKETASE